MLVAVEAGESPETVAERFMVCRSSVFAGWWRAMKGFAYHLNHVHFENRGYIGPQSGKVSARRLRSELPDYDFQIGRGLALSPGTQQEPGLFQERQGSRCSRKPYWR